ncbi:MAG: PAS domain S-box protein [Smithellaceae bacterium]|nr:PAS domain S-box protein [Smithellaceae bacterium]
MKKNIDVRHKNKTKSLDSHKLGKRMNLPPQKKAKEILKKTEEYFHLLSEATNEGIAIHDNGIIIESNQSLIDMFGYDLSEMIGMTAAKLVSPESMKVMMGHIANRYDMPFEAVGVRKNGSTIICSIVCKPFKYKGRTLRVATFHDITERKQMEEKLRESEANYRQLFENSPAGLYQIDFKTGKITRANDVLCKYAGWSPKEICSLNISDVFSEGSKKLYLERLEKLLRGEKVSEIVEYEVLNKKGQRFYLQLHNKYIYDAEGNVIASDVVAHNVTERKLAENDLRKERDFSNAIIDSLPGWFYVVDENLRFLRWNDNLMRVSGYSNEELLGKSVLDFHHESDRSTVSEQVKQSFLRGENTIERNVILRDGTVKTFLFSSKKLQFKGRPCLVGTAIDITEKKQAQEELKQFAENLEDANIALRVLMNRRDEGQKDIEGKLQANINDLVIPYLKKLKQANLDDRNKNYLDVLERNLTDVLSPFMRDFLSSHKNLTPQEIQIVDLITKGKNTKEIAEMLNASVNTIATHRNNIRKKMNLKNSKINLRSHVLSIRK